MEQDNPHCDSNSNSSKKGDNNDNNNNSDSNKNSRNDNSNTSNNTSKDTTSNDVQENENKKNRMPDRNHNTKAVTFPSPLFSWSGHTRPLANCPYELSYAYAPPPPPPPPPVRDICYPTTAEPIRIPSFKNSCYSTIVPHTEKVASPVPCVDRTSTPRSGLLTPVSSLQRDTSKIIAATSTSLPPPPTPPPSSKLSKDQQYATTGSTQQKPNPINASSIAPAPANANATATLEEKDILQRELILSRLSRARSVLNNKNGSKISDKNSDKISNKNSSISKNGPSNQHRNPDADLYSDPADPISQMLHLRAEMKKRIPRLSTYWLVRTIIQINKTAAVLGLDGRQMHLWPGGGRPFTAGWAERPTLVWDRIPDEILLYLWSWLNWDKMVDSSDDDDDDDGDDDDDDNNKGRGSSCEDEEKEEEVIVEQSFVFPYSFSSSSGEEGEEEEEQYELIDTHMCG